MEHHDCEPVEVERIALNMNQIKMYNPPPNPAKVTDSRAVGYIAEFGEDSWELDALEPRVIADLIEKQIRLHLKDTEQFEKRQALIQEGRKLLGLASENWGKILKLIQKKKEK